MKTSFQLQGALELSRALAEIKSEVATKVGEGAVRSTAKLLEMQLVLTAPYDPTPGGLSDRYGHLRTNIRTRKIKPRKETEVIYRVGTGRAFWGNFSEWGTAKMPAQPWYRPTWDRMEGPMAMHLVDATRKGLDRVAKRAARLALKGR